MNMIGKKGSGSQFSVDFSLMRPAARMPREGAGRPPLVIVEDKQDSFRDSSAELRPLINTQGMAGVVPEGQY